MKQENIKFANQVSDLKGATAETVYLFLKKTHEDAVLLAHKMLTGALSPSAEAFQRILDEAITDYKAITIEMARDIVGVQEPKPKTNFWLSEQEFQAIVEDSRRFKNQ